MTWEIQGTKLISTTKKEYEIDPHEFWYVVPARSHYSAHEGKKVRPLEFAFVMHNAFIEKRLLPSPTFIGEGMEAKTMKGGVANDAEALLEAVRVEYFPMLPSRLRCYFLNIDKDIATYRMADSLRGNKILVRCFIILDEAKVHFADSRIYEQLESRPEDKNLAIKYWQTFDRRNDSDNRHLEILVDAKLYLPDWETFPTISKDSLIAWQMDNPPQSFIKP